jgi:hypothetical protein
MEEKHAQARDKKVAKSEQDKHGQWGKSTHFLGTNGISISILGTPLPFIVGSPRTFAFTNMFEIPSILSLLACCCKIIILLSLSPIF